MSSTLETSFDFLVFELPCADELPCLVAAYLLKGQTTSDSK